MENFIYYTPTKVYFGKGQVDNVGNIIKEYKPNKVLIHYGGRSALKSGLIDKVKNLLTIVNVPFVELGGVCPNPVLSLVRKGIELCKKEKVDFILAIGGGSVLDSAKDIANGLANPDVDVWDFSLGKASPKATIKKGCILTISAAGSEMSNSCVISNEITKQKKGYGTDFNRFDFAIEDPTLTFSVSPYQTSCGIVDIAMHTIERYFDLGSDTSITDDIALALIKNVNENGIKCLKNPNDYDARSNIMWASSLAHNGLTHCGREFLLTVHQLEHPLSALYPEIAHGAGLAAVWCSWARYSYKSNIERWKKYALKVWDINPALSDEDIINKAIDKQEKFYHEIGMPTSLEELNVKESDIEPLSLVVSNNKTRIIKGYKPLGYDDVLEIYKMAFKRKF